MSAAQGVQILDPCLVLPLEQSQKDLLFCLEIVIDRRSGERGLLPDLLQCDLLEAPGLIEYGTGIDNLRFPRVRQLF